MGMPKFKQSLSVEIYDKLLAISKRRGIEVQELIRSVIIPEWLEDKEKGVSR